MVVMFSGFDDRGWWLVALGCRGGRGSLRLAEKLAGKQLERDVLLLWGREKEERENGVFGRARKSWPDTITDL